LAGSGAYADRSQNPFPTLVLLDLKEKWLRVAEAAVS
jgi:hypothetical protein